MASYPRFDGNAPTVPPPPPTTELPPPVDSPKTFQALLDEGPEVLREFHALHPVTYQKLRDSHFDKFTVSHIRGGTIRR